MIAVIVILVLLVISLVLVLIYDIKKHNTKYTVDIIISKAKSLGLDHQNLKTSMGGIDKDHYEELQRIMAMEAYKAIIRSIIIANVSALAAVISAICAIYAAFLIH